MLPKMLKDAIAHIDGIGFAGRCNIDAFPKLARTMSDYQAGGMDGAIKIDMGQEPLEMELTFAEHNELVLATFGTCSHNGVSMRINASAESDNPNCAQSAIEILAKGRFTELDMGGFKPKENTEMKVKADLSYYKYSVDGAPIIEIDIANYIFIVKGVDMYEQRRKNLKI